MKENSSEEQKNEEIGNGSILKSIEFDKINMKLTKDSNNDVKNQAINKSCFNKIGNILIIKESQGVPVLCLGPHCILHIKQGTCV